MKVKPETFLVETEKALKIVERKVREQMHEMTPGSKLKVINELLEKVNDFYQFEELKKEKELVEFEIKNSGPKQFIPLDVQKKIEVNREIEMAELHKVLSIKYAELGKHLAIIEQSLQSKVLPLLNEINSLHDREYSISQLDKFLGADYGYTIGDSLVTRFNQASNMTNENVKAKCFIQTVESFATEMKEVKFK